MDIPAENDLFYTERRGGVGTCSLGRATCGMCGRVFNPDAETVEDPDNLGNQEYREIRIGDLTILDCCFPRLERLYLYLSLNTNAVHWLSEQLVHREDILKRQLNQVKVKQEVADTIRAILGTR